MSYRRKHDRDMPRGWFSLFIRMGGWSAFIFGVALIVMTLFSATSLHLADRMDRDGRFSRAVIVDKRITESVDSDGDTTHTYYATFRYKSVHGGQEVEENVGRSFYMRVSEGEEHVIRYLDTEPTTIEYEIGQLRTGGIVLRWIGLVFGLGGLWTLWRFGSKANRAVLARRDGEKRFASVTGIEELNLEINDKRQARLLWREEDGQEGRSFMRDLAELSRLYSAGDEIVVFRMGEDAYWEGDVGPPRREIAETG